MLTCGYDTPLGLLKSELTQLAYEGCIIPESVQTAVAQLDRVRDAYNEQEILKFHGILEGLQPDPEFHYIQPNDLAEIRRLRPDGPRKLTMKLHDTELLDRFHGAWTGRACGCALGKPVEGLGSNGHGNLNGRLAIKEYLKNRGHWPLDSYFSEAAGADGITLKCMKSCREHIRYMEPDDDIHYTLIGLHVLEECGPGFVWSDVANAWNSCLPYNALCTAETQAMLNYNMLTPRWQKTAATPEFTRRFRNPYREWIGAQIRADGWAYACAGNPERAAEFAWRDAHWTHTANGIYGEMFVAAMIAAAFVEHDPATIVNIGLSEIPAGCRLAEDIRWALETIPACPDFESFMEKSEDRFAGMSPVHTVNNAVIVVMSLFYGKMNPDRSICTAVMGALDTDCNGATVGSIVGAATGQSGFGGVLAAPLHDMIKPNVFGFQEITMKELAERTLKAYKAVLTGE